VNGSIEGVVTAIVEDEGWQGNLTNDEHRLCVEWAERRLREALGREKTYVCGILSSFNWMMRSNPIDRGDVIKTTFGA
jgi:hypothetical protein